MRRPICLGDPEHIDGNNGVWRAATQTSVASDHVNYSHAHLNAT
jgi:hypothetical protein